LILALRNAPKLPSHQQIRHFVRNTRKKQCLNHSHSRKAIALENISTRRKLLVERPES